MTQELKLTQAQRFVQLVEQNGEVPVSDPRLQAIVKKPTNMNYVACQARKLQPMLQTIKKGRAVVAYAFGSSSTPAASVPAASE